MRIGDYRKDQIFLAQQPNLKYEPEPKTPEVCWKKGVHSKERHTILLLPSRRNRAKISFPNSERPFSSREAFVHLKYKIQQMHAKFISRREF